MTSPEQAELVPVADGVFAWIQADGSWWINNAGAITTPEGVIIVDTCATEERTRALLTAVAGATHDAPVTYAVNTHEHGDHTYGNSVLPESTVIVGHQATRAGLIADQVIDGCPPFWSPVPDWGQVVRRPPTVTTSTDLTIHSGSQRLDLLHPGFAAHTTGDLVAWLPDQRVLFAGDLLFSQVTPLVFMGSLDGALRSLDWIAGFDPQHVVPGHGPLIDANSLDEVLETHRRYYRLVLDTARAGLDAGLTPLDAARKCSLGPFADLPDAERIVLNLHRAYADAQHTELDIFQAFADAVTLNGGPMHTAV
ncbi:MBL fold metallo-hydrolase [Streptomyces sp. NPDC090493]|uniref:MBL fold metallo-hydrolase n=1 Tax=Streptomyces sp. NPDC090493 TaxID=3365964 RepID=UPI0037FA878F